MIIDAALAMKANDKLKAAIGRASAHKLSPTEVLDQRVSFVFGSMSKDNGVTKDRVRQVILDQVVVSEASTN
jgi:hypothetical protein